MHLYISFISVNKNNFFLVNNNNTAEIIFLSLQNETTTNNPTEILLSPKELFASADKHNVLLNKGDV